MNIKCPCCGDCFAANEDHLRWDYSEDVNYDDSKKFVWEKIPLLRSSWDYNDDIDIKKEQILKEKDNIIPGENH